MRVVLRDMWRKNIFAEVDRAARRISFKLLGAPVLSKLGEAFYDFGYA